MCYLFPPSPLFLTAASQRSDLRPLPTALLWEGGENAKLGDLRAHSARRSPNFAKIIIHTDNAPKSLAGYSQAVKAGGFVFVAGQGPFDPMTGDVLGETIQEHTRQCLKNVEAILEAAGSSLDKVVSATFILGDPNDFAGMNEEWVRWFPKDPPARQGAKLPIQPKGMKVSIAVIAEA